MVKTQRNVDVGGTGAGPDHDLPPGPTRWQVVVGAVGLFVVLWAGGNLWDVVTSDGAVPSGARTPGAVPDDAEGSPPEGGAHDPSRFDHGRP